MTHLPALTRRSAIGLAAMAAAAPRLRAQEALPSLAQAAAACGVVYGSDSDVNFANTSPAYRALFLQQCRLYAPIIHWEDPCPDPCTNPTGKLDPNIPFAVDNGLRLTGGHLLWHESTPKWFEQVGSQAEARAIASREITHLVTRYAGHVFSWNVCNELIAPEDGRPDAMRQTSLINQLGVDYLPTAFKLARQADPKALLTVNEFGGEMASREGDARRAGLLRLLDRLAKAQAPVMAVGFQSHLRLDGSRFDPNAFRAFLHEISGRGLKILITELDVFDLERTSDIARRDADVAALYGEFLRAALDETAVISVVNWGLTDRYTWLKPETKASYVRADRQPSRPLPFDDQLRPKPAFYAMIEAFRHAPKRTS